MIPLYEQKDLDISKSGDKLPCECEICSKVFYKMKRDVLKALKGGSPGKYCSKKCMKIGMNVRKNVICSNCNKEVIKKPSEIKQSKSGNHFCSKSCAAIYNNAHKTSGNRRSKLEIYLEKELKYLYPELKIEFNQTNAIDAELDIYIPSLKLAFELNGIFHYEPIYGLNKLNKVQNNDNRKFQACIERGIELCIIDTSQQKYFRVNTSEKYLNIIINIISLKII